eukprot:m51a1_g4304 putative tubby protein homolog isoform x3 (665) ;mRNA; f:20121-22687
MSLYADESSSDGEDPQMNPAPSADPRASPSSPAGGRPATATAAQKRARMAAAQAKRKQQVNTVVAATEIVPAATQPRVIRVAQSDDAVDMRSPQQQEPEAAAAAAAATPKTAAARRRLAAKTAADSDASAHDSENALVEDAAPAKRVPPVGQREDVLAGSGSENEDEERERRARAVAAAKKRKLQQQRLAAAERAKAAAAAEEQHPDEQPPAQPEPEVAAEGEAAAKPKPTLAARKAAAAKRAAAAAAEAIAAAEAEAEAGVEASPKPKPSPAAAARRKSAAAAAAAAAAEGAEAEGSPKPKPNAAAAARRKAAAAAAAAKKAEEEEGKQKEPEAEVQAEERKETKEPAAPDRSSDSEAGARPVSPQKKSASKELERAGISDSFDPTGRTDSAASRPVARVDPGIDGPLQMIPPKDVFEFVSRPGPKGTFLQCKIQRMNKGMDRIYPTYFLYIEETNQFLLAARKRKRSTSSNYLISTNQADLARKSESFVGKVRSNFMGSEFLVYDNGANPKKTDETSKRRKELAAIFYGTNMLGLSGPRKMTILVPARGDTGECLENQPGPADKSMADRFKAGETTTIVGLHNKSPVWDEESQTYTLNFHQRVKLPSVKNFQVVHPDNVEEILMQFGRVTEFVFSLDFKYPLSLLQAFGIALTSFDNKIACE